jgi:hypothetical protein
VKQRLRKENKKLVALIVEAKVNKRALAVGQFPGGCYLIYGQEAAPSSSPLKSLKV